MLVKEGAIDCVLEGGEAPADAAVIDLKGKWLLPGLIDVHLHLGGSPELDDHAGNHGHHFTWDYAYNVNRLLAHGVTAVRSGGDCVPDIIDFRNETENCSICGPRIVAPGRFAQAYEGHRPTPSTWPTRSDRKQLRHNPCWRWGRAHQAADRPHRG